MQQTTQTKTKVKTSKKALKTSSTQKFLRLPIDAKTDLLIRDIINENPFFTPLDAVRFILGKHIRQNNRKKMLEWLKENVENKNLPSMSEDEIFAIVENNNLSR